MLKGKTVVLGVTGSIAAYKIANLASMLVKLHAEVHVIMTENATQFINPITFETLTNHKCLVETFDRNFQFHVAHVSLAQQADLMLIAPASANTIAKIANGFADNLLTSTVLATKTNLIFALAMNTNMLNNVMTQANVNKLRDLGHEFIDSDYGMLACGDVGSGRMAEPKQIFEYLEDYFTEKDLAGYRITITAGPTEQALDPVRYMTNRSTGKMGYALAKNAKARGAHVTLISGPTSIEVPDVDEFISVRTTEEMYEAVKSVFHTSDCVIKSAAPLDYKPVSVSDIKIKKGDSETNLNLEFERTIDIAETLGSEKKNQIFVGFAAETNDVVQYAKGKMEKKNFDFVVANNVSESGSGFGVDTNRVSIVNRDGTVDDLPLMSKLEVADEILDKVKKLLKAR